MPKGVYPRTANQLKAAPANLAKGHSPESRAKANVTMRKLAQSEQWRDRVSESGKKAWQDPELRKRHKDAMKGLPVNFKGGNGQPMTEVVKMAWAILEPLGFMLEYPIKTRGQSTSHNPPLNYKADFANPHTKVVIELDGPSHRSRRQKLLDRKKTEVLESLGWTVIRLQH